MHQKISCQYGRYGLTPLGVSAFAWPSYRFSFIRSIRNLETLQFSGVVSIKCQPATHFLTALSNACPAHVRRWRKGIRVRWGCVPRPALHSSIVNRKRHKDICKLIWKAPEVTSARTVSWTTVRNNNGIVHLPLLQGFSAAVSLQKFLPLGHGVLPLKVGAPRGRQRAGEGDWGVSVWHLKHLPLGHVIPYCPRKETSRWIWK